jgi:hypothetical protein
MESVKKSAETADESASPLAMTETTSVEMVAVVNAM